MHSKKYREKEKRKCKQKKQFKSYESLNVPLKASINSSFRVLKFYISIVKVKSDHCSKFTNLSNWKEEA